MKKESTTDYTDVTDKELAALRVISGGADVLSRSIAETLRGLEKRHPKLLRITKRMGKYSVRERLPYFGAILTKDGERLIESRKGAAA